MKRFLLLVTFFTLSAALFGQSFQIMRFGIEDGLCHESTYNMNQDSHGFLWIATTQGLCRFDGKNFTSNFLGDQLPSSIAQTSFIDSKGRVWFGYMDGFISYFDGVKFTVLEPEEDSKSNIVGFVEDKSGDILAMTQSTGLIIIGSDMTMTYDTNSFPGKFVSKAYLMDDGKLLVGGFDGLSLYTRGNDSIYFSEIGLIPGLPFARIQTIVSGQVPDTYWIGTEDEGMFMISGKGGDLEEYVVTQIGIGQGIGYSSINSIYTGDKGYLWISDYGYGVYRFRVDEAGELTDKLFFNEKSGLPELYIKDIFQDDEGNIWFASQGSGIAVLRDQAFTFYSFEQDQDIPAISAICTKGIDNWFGSEAGLIWINRDKVSDRRVYTTVNGLPNDKITDLFLDADKNLYVALEYSGVYLLKNGSQRLIPFFKADNSLGNSINAIDGDENTIWLATNNGVYSVDLKNGAIDHRSTNTGLPHNVINDIMIDHEGEVWIATRSSGLYCITKDESYTLQGDPKLEFVDMTIDAQENIWATTKEDGVFKFDSDSIAAFSTDNGLKAKYTYAVGIDPNGQVWVGHRLGLSKIDPETRNISVFGPETGFTSDILYRSINVNEDGVVFFGTNDGLIVYDSKRARKDTIAPRLSVVQLNISDSIYDTSADIKLPYGAYKIRIDFVGINLSSPEQVTYQYKLEGFDLDWSEPTRETFARYPRIEDGQYTFLLKACDGNSNCSEEPLSLNISVKIPIWKAWWFIVTLIVVAIFSVFLIIKIRERKQKALQEYLETQLDVRTREVIHQKEEIETKNRDITDSINYAQRIQASILPPIKKLHNTFSGSFVFYQPRDIVSGDFYWYDRLGEDKFLIVCADSTGHGVPGAFMSMIGTTLIKDICLRPDVKKPSDVLRTLDLEVREALNQNMETDGSNDGMDIIVAEFDLKTNMFSVSSAMRPVILYLNGEQIYVKGSRSSVGGQLDDEHATKEFDNQQFQLNKGDIVYMFSDGYPDQFGGPLGRKFKMVRLKNLLRDIHDKPMEDQYNYIKSNFFLWKEDLEQVDDVLFMGVKI